jgi:hypothetical protein
MTPIASIVEGDGEVHALPVLLRRICEWQTPDRRVQVLPPIRVRRDLFINKALEFERYLLLAASKCGASGWILVLIDADDDCPAATAPRVLDRAVKIVPHRPVSVVMANRELEAWFIAAADSLNGYRSLSIPAGDPQIDPEGPRDAKGWIRQRMTSGTYSETTDQAKFCSRLDLQLAHDRSRSFRKLCSDWRERMRDTAAHHTT